MHAKNSLYLLFDLSEIHSFKETFYFDKFGISEIHA